MVEGTGKGKENKVRKESKAIGIKDTGRRNSLTEDTLKKTGRNKIRKGVDETRFVSLREPSIGAEITLAPGFARHERQNKGRGLGSLWPEPSTVLGMWLALYTILK